MPNLKKSESNLPVKFDYGEQAGKGRDEMKSEIRLPFINLLQDLSPQVKKSNEKYIDGAEVGMFHNNVTDDVMSDFSFIVVKDVKSYVEWVPKERGGGLVADHPNRPAGLQPHPLKKSAMVNAEGNEIVETVVLYGVLSNESVGVVPARIACTSTKLAALSKFQTRLSSFESGMLQSGTYTRDTLPPPWAYKLEFTSVDAQNAAGQDYKAMKIEPVGGEFGTSLIDPSSNEFMAAIELRNQFMAGEISTEVEDTVNEEEAF